MSQADEGGRGEPHRERIPGATDRAPENRPRPGSGKERICARDVDGAMTGAARVRAHSRVDLCSTRKLQGRRGARTMRDPERGPSPSGERGQRGGVARAAITAVKTMIDTTRGAS